MAKKKPTEIQIIRYGLKSLAENNQEVLAFHNKGQKHELINPNGIACPMCGSELSDSMEGIIRGSHPARIKVSCMACGHGDYRYVMPAKKEGLGG